MITTAEKTYQRPNTTCWKQKTWFVEIFGLRLPIWGRKTDCPTPRQRKGTLH